MAIVPFAAIFAGACGGSDTIPDEDGSADAMALDGAPAPLDGSSADGTVADTGSDATVVDGSADDGSASAPDAADAQAFDGSDGSDGSEPGEGGKLGDGGDGGKEEDASDGSSGLDASDASDASVDAGLTDASDASLDADITDASDASDGEVVDGSLAPGILGSAALFAVFSGATVTNATGTLTTITGDLGTYPSNTAIGPTPPVVVGAEHLGDGVAQIAAGDIQAAYDKLTPGNLPCGTQLTGLDLGGMTLTPGVYCFASTAGMTGILTLDAQNDPDAVWVFQVGSALTTASGSQVVVINGAAGQACNAYWQISSSATLGTNSVFGGNILAQAAVTVTTGTVILGRTFGMSALVSTDTNVISIAACAVTSPILDAGRSDAEAADARAADAAGD